MSRIGKQPIPVPADVEVQVRGQEVLVKGPLGELTRRVPKELNLKLNDSELLVMPANRSRRGQALWGLWRTLLQNALQGVLQGFNKELELVGVGFKAEVRERSLVLNVGYSHPVEYQIPPEVSVKVEKNLIKVTGIDKQQVGQVTAAIRSLKRPEPYKGKGIRYVGEEIRLKPGKAGKAVGVGGG